eukprot:GHVR01165475.1.p1 GENE.GHVR01165475.1~~GHVR01165475.1.p1  ORF type:complete len:143 (+),score=75.46 GHVR01165475.1:50-478(+)
MQNINTDIHNNNTDIHNNNTNIQSNKNIQSNTEDSYAGKLYSNIETTNTREIEIFVNGMTCAACVGVVNKSIKKLQGVASVTVNFMLGYATVLLDTHTHTDEYCIINAVEECGFDASLKSIRNIQHTHTHTHTHKYTHTKYS